MGFLQFFINKLRREKVEQQLDKQIDYNHMTLMHKDEPIIDLDFGALGISSCSNLRDISRLPLGVINPQNPQTIGNIDYKTLGTFIGIWLEYRTIPHSRPNIQQCLEKCGIQTTTELTCRSLGLSFSDSYWFKPRELEISWEDVNLYKNGFSEDIGDILINPTTNKPHINYISPDSTTRGEDAKRWIQENGNAYLLKTNTSIEQTAYNEVVAMKIAEKLKLKCAQYEALRGTITIMQNGEPITKDCTFSKSKNFCTENRTYMPADYMRIMTQTNSTKDLIDIIKVRNPAIYKEFQKMLVLDFIINNEDRHSENFGFELDENGNLYFGCIFDNGNSLYFDRSNSAIGDISNCKFDGYFNNEFMLYKHIKYKDELDFFNINEFQNIKEEIIAIYKQSSMDEARIQKLANFIEQQILEVQKLKDRLPERIVIKDDINREDR